MKMLSKVEKAVERITHNRIVDRKQLTKSYVSLFLIVAVLVTTTVCWFTVKDSAKLDTSAITMTASSGLRVNNGEDLTGVVKLATGVKLAEASSVDGRNMYFPTTGTFSSSTDSMVFREGNAGDKNSNYYYNDFSLTADSGETDVYVKSYEVKIGDQTYNGTPGSHQACPLRMAFIQDSSETPIVVDPTAIVSNYTTTLDAVASTDVNGSATTATSTSHAFSEYYYGNKPIFTIQSNKALALTMVIWLDGTGENCDHYVGQDISVDIQFESNWEHMDTIKFIDDTEGDVDKSVRHWINTDGCLVTMTYYDTKTEKYKTVIMTKSSSYSTDYTWTGALPDYITTDITFNRYNPESEVVWNAWYTCFGVNTLYSDQKVTGLDETRLKTSGGTTVRARTYTAKGGNGYETTEHYRPYPCRGNWSFTQDVVEVTTTVLQTEAQESTSASSQSATTQPVVTEPTEPTTLSANVTTTIILRDMTEYKTIYNECEYSPYNKIFVLLTDGTEYEIGVTGDEGKFIGTNLSVVRGKTISKFEERTASGTFVRTLAYTTGGSSIIFNQNNYTYTLEVREENGNYIAKYN